jgi:hypothetical protein
MLRVIFIPFVNGFSCASTAENKKVKKKVAKMLFIMGLNLFAGNSE